MMKSLRFLLPLSNAHWSLRVVLWFVIAYFFAWRQCREGSQTLPVVALTATVCIVLWNSHVREMPIANWKSALKVPAGALHDLLLLLLWQLPLLILLPAYECYGDRAKIFEMVALSPPLFAEIESRAKQHGSLVDSGVGLAVPHGKYLSGGIISKDGTIIEISENPAAVVMWVPEFSAGAVTWKCTGFPKKSMSVECRH